MDDLIAEDAMRTLAHLTPGLEAANLRGSHFGTASTYSASAKTRFPADPDADAASEDAPTPMSLWYPDPGEEGTVRLVKFIGTYAATLLDLRTLLATLSGRLGDAERLLAQCTRLTGESDSQHRFSTAYAAAETRRLAGDLDGARSIIAELVAEDAGNRSRWHAGPLVWLGLRIEADRAIVARGRGETYVDDGTTGRLAVMASRLPGRTPAQRGYAATAHAEHDRRAVVLSGGPPTGVGFAAWGTAVECWRAADEPYPLAYCLFRLAENYHAAGARQATTESAREAARLAADLGAAPLLADVEALTRRAGLASTCAARTSVRDAPSLARFGLTRREREVLDLLATGRSNPQIGAELFISPKTASVHVSNILAKLGVSGRGEAAALVHRLSAADPWRVQRP